MRGITVTPAQCAALPQAVWLNVIGPRVLHPLLPVDRRRRRHAPGRSSCRATGSAGSICAPANTPRAAATRTSTPTTRPSRRGDLSKQSKTTGDLSAAARRRRLLRRPSHPPQRAGAQRHQRGARRDQAAPPLRRLPPGRPVRRLDAGRRHAGAAHRHRLRGDRLRPARPRPAAAPRRPIRPRHTSTSPMRFRRSRSDARRASWW